jgi:hypothetical protein
VGSRAVPRGRGIRPHRAALFAAIALAAIVLVPLALLVESVGAASRELDLGRFA